MRVERASAMAGPRDRGELVGQDSADKGRRFNLGVLTSWDPSLKTLCKMAALQYCLDPSCLPCDIRSAGVWGPSFTTAVSVLQPEEVGAGSHDNQQQYQLVDRLPWLNEFRHG
ncbi:hypothetical protein SKAU_G00179560 [Synaphobranchus kaupii]|uniref:Uncharacterized protein n=1 Tax=Synaphobranchus kaupii TaxID=118154 RepID=A0A9Q1FM48_SYNKA|nr:hypothetical protein SKAU_G00179560 [Synaphobranchus kaupii]